jgi:predicted molibdopterin-dependent oxidoreductase YjgC
MAIQEIFEPYDRLIAVNILGREFAVPANNSILRCLQFLSMESISEADLCWNGECMDCQVWIESGEKEKALIACRAPAEEGMKIVRLSEAIETAFAPDGK